VADLQAAIRAQLSRQGIHWTGAASRLANLDDLASPGAWQGLERYLGLSIRRHLAAVVTRLVREGEPLQAMLTSAVSPDDLTAVRRHLLAFRSRYSRVEMTLLFFADAINTRTNPKMSGYLKACDILAYRSMAMLLDQLGKPTPNALSYLEKGIGAAVLRANLRLWDGTGVNPVAAIKVTHHNLLRNTALIHEAGHQAAAVVGWNEELASKLDAGLRAVRADVAGEWASWASEIAADAFAFVHTGYAAVAALHDVVADERAAVFRHTPGDPHPISYIRVLLGVEMCRQFYGAGPWDDLAQAWVNLYPLDHAPDDTRALLEASLPILPNVVRITLSDPMRAFQGRSLVGLINPDRVKPEALWAMDQQLGAALYTSMHWIWTEALRLLALTGLRIATTPEKKIDTFETPEEWLLRLGGALRAA
jgi:hypothetical protein